MITKTKSIQEGSKVSLHIRMTLENGFVVEDTSESEPLRITIGNGSLDPVLEKSLLGLSESENKDIPFEAGEVFGMPAEENIQTISRDQFAGFDEDQLQPGVIMSFDSPAGDQIPGMIIGANEDTLTIDFNHPLAGKAFTFSVEVLSVD